ncbi:MAG TPA: hypothetical protein VJB16_04155 [archaeon]|nr:hypothetical protein [archaeon]
MLPKNVERVLRENKKWFEMLEEYDRTGVWPLERKRVDLTLSRRTIAKLRAKAAAEGKSVSRVVDELVERAG